jgi:hypothetical protein
VAEDIAVVDTVVVVAEEVETEEVAAATEAAAEDAKLYEIKKMIHLKDRQATVLSVFFVFRMTFQSLNICV